MEAAEMHLGKEIQSEDSEKKDDMAEITDVSKSDLDDWEVVDKSGESLKDDMDLVGLKGSPSTGADDTIQPQSLPYPEHSNVTDDTRMPEMMRDAGEEEIISRTEIEESEECMEDGRRIRIRIITTRQTRPVIISEGKITEELVGVEIEEEILDLAPGVREPLGYNVDSETSVDEYAELLPNGALLKRKLTSITVTQKALSSDLVDDQGNGATPDLVCHESVKEDSPETPQHFTNGPSEVDYNARLEDPLLNGGQEPGVVVDDQPSKFSLQPLF